MSRPLLSLVLLALAVPALPAEEERAEKLARLARPSLVTITITGRGGRQEGLGTGFVVGDGLIATNLHVIGEARPVTIELADGKKVEPVAIHASSRALDLAILRVEVKGLKPLPLADSSRIRDGQFVVALGNPHGLKNSVTAGVLSGRRDIDGKKMLQVAIPVERGNSGGPLLNADGQVVGIMTAKSLVTANLGFAMESNALKGLLNSPNPVAMKAWLTIGILDEEEWKPVGGASWRRRSGIIVVEGLGTGFGGRSFCLHQRPTPELPFEATVTVKLDDESGAAGLIFHADGGDRHYGFYPSSGGLRLTRFDGSDVYSWKILEQARSPHYRPGDWNVLKVRLEKGRIRCYVNGHLAIEAQDAEYSSGKVGLAKFRHTRAEFKHFRVAKNLDPASPSKETENRVRKALEALRTPRIPAKDLEKLSKEGQAGLDVLRAEVRRREEEIARLRKLVRAVAEKQIHQAMEQLLREKPDRVDLVHAALLIAQLDQEDLDLQAYRDDFDRLAKKLAGRVKKDASEGERLKALDNFFFTERGFHGSRGAYYSRANSYLNEVLDDREGIPITLSLLYLELGKRIGLKLEGVGLPGKFVVRHLPASGKPRLIDVYEGGKELTRAEVEKQVEEFTGEKFDEKWLRAVTPRQLLFRMLSNLLGIAQRDQDLEGLLRYLDLMLVLEPKAGPERALRAAARLQSGDRPAALEDLDWLLENKPEGIDLDRIKRMRSFLTEDR